MSSDSTPSVGVLARPRRIAEALRMASALPLSDLAPEVILTADHLPDTDEVALHLDTLDLSDVPVFAMFTDPRVTTVTAGELAAKLAGYDHVITF